jgi:large subunit ribosomal protein L24e
MTKCVFCGKEEHTFRGVTLIKNDGSTNFFCSSKCRVNALKLKRDKRKLKWTLAHKEERAKLAVKVKKAEEKHHKPVEHEKKDKKDKKE